MRKIYALYLLMPALLLGACKKDHDDDEGTGKDLILTASEQQKAEADNEFTFKFLKKSTGGADMSKNLMISPLSMSMALGMTSNGANGTTLEAMRNALEFKNFTEAEVNSYYHKLITDLPELDPKATVKIANSIWYKNNFTPLPAFLQVNSANYKAGAEQVDFSDPATKTKINNWVNTNTNGKIPTLIDNIPPTAMLYLINAVYFKSQWATKFETSKTVRASFNTSATNSVMTDFMTASNMPAKVAFRPDKTIVELPYGNQKYSMVIVLPDAGKSVTEVVNSLTAAEWKSWMSSLADGKKEIKLPKFKFAYQEQNMIDYLRGLGMGVAFTTSADFTRINAAGGLLITEVKHKAFIEVNEEGTEAAAATSVGVGATAAPSQAIVIDRPFLFAIREMKTGLVVFTGIVNNPTLSE